MNETSHIGRLVVVGRNSKVWLALSCLKQFDDIALCGIGHAQVQEFIFLPGDRVWIFSYSRFSYENRKLLESLAAHNFIDVNYISSASTNVVNLTNCYSYPAVKWQAEKDAKIICSARIVRIGLVYRTLAELPSGDTAATSLNELANFMVSGLERDRSEVNLFTMAKCPFANDIERILFIFYGKLLTISCRFPCLLRPVDFILRAFNMRWYGYLYLSNRLWSTTI